MMKSARRHDAGTGGASPVRTMELGAGAVRTVTPDEQGLMVVCISGAVWITQTTGARDVILRGGGSFTSGASGCVVIEPIGGDARIGILRTPRAAPAHERWIARLHARLRAIITGKSGARQESYCN